MTRFVLFTLLAVVAGAAAVLSFSALEALAEVCGFSPRLAWLVPVVLDAGAAAGSVTWLSTPPGLAKVFGRRLALVLLSASVLGNAVGHVLSAYNLRPVWVLVVAVSALAPAILGATIHLAVVAAQANTERPEDVSGDPAPASSPVQVGQGDDDGDNLTVPDGGNRAAELIAEGAGRRRLAKELGVSEYEARQLMNGHRNGNGVA